MSDAFNPYRAWLGLAQAVVRWEHYELLGLRRYEDNRELILSAASQAARRLEPHLAGPQAALARRLLNEVTAARDCLLDHEAKRQYDQQLTPATGADPDRPLPEFSPPAADKIPLGASPSGLSEPPAALPAPADRRPRRPAPRPRAVPPPLPAGPELQSLEDDDTAPRVPMLGKLALDSVLEELVQTLDECRELYLSCAVRPDASRRGVSRQLAAGLERLHRGLVLKVCASVAEADGRWAYEEQRCAAAVWQHVGVECSPDKLQETAERLSRQAAQLEWADLLQPFDALPTGQDRRAELLTVVTRLANLIAKADGSVSASETAALRQLQSVLRVRPPKPAASSRPPLSAAAAEVLDQVQPAQRVGATLKAAQPLRATPADFRKNCLQRMNALVGLSTVKQELRDLADLATFQRQRRQAGLPSDATEFQWVFLGPPGTGKATVAGILADLLWAVGLLKRPRLVVINPVLDLVSPEARDIEQRLGLKIAKAIGGTLFVDHASVLLTAEGQPYAPAVHLLQRTLAKFRGQMAVILADQSPRLSQVLAQNPELAACFTRRLVFPEQNAGQLGQVFQAFCDRSHYRVTRAAQIKLLLGFRWRLEQDGARCGHGHLVRQVFEEAVHRLAHRIAGITPLTKELLSTFEDDDIAIPGVPGSVNDQLDNPELRFVVACPGCGCENQVGPNYLGIRVECNRCHHRFECRWGEPVKKAGTD